MYRVRGKLAPSGRVFRANLPHDNAIDALEYIKTELAGRVPAGEHITLVRVVKVEGQSAITISENAPAARKTTGGGGGRKTASKSGRGR